ncbi:MAG: flagellar basal body P-ring protein FlgI [Saccharospirillaceae bacterium]|nr:flagellar basal body P-ring protein FlgI [Pseudomonadales bacterium]NRB79729.1 flagellar basal body P-ring protein FlgI [Saccharospirillaceae bacterium]
MNKIKIFFVLLLVSQFTNAVDVRIKDISRIEGSRNNMLVGNGIVTGLSGTGDSAGNKLTLQSVSNMLKRFGVNVSSSDIRSRNVAAVSIQAIIPPFAQPGDHIDITVTSIGDARSLSGGSLLLTELRGPDLKIYALAQGALSVGGFKQGNQNVSVSKNHTTSAIISNGAIVEVEIESVVVKNKQTHLLLHTADITTAIRITDKINTAVSQEVTAIMINPGKIKLIFNNDDNYKTIAEIQALTVEPDFVSKVVINEKTGTVISGANVRISPIVLSHGALKIQIGSTVSTFEHKQDDLTGYSKDMTIRSSLDYQEKTNVISFKESVKIEDLIMALSQVKLSSRDIISVLQALKESGALHAELVVQ